MAGYTAIIEEPDELRELYRQPTISHLKKQILAIFNDYPEGLKIKLFEEVYREKYGKELPLAQFGFTSVIDYFTKNVDVFDVIRRGIDPAEWIVTDIPIAVFGLDEGLEARGQVLQKVKTHIKEAIERFIYKNRELPVVGLPLVQLPTVFKKLFRRVLRHELLGYRTLYSMCMNLEGNEFKLVSFGEHVFLILTTAPWFPTKIDTPGPPVNTPPDMLGPDATFFEFDYRTYLKYERRMEIKIVKHDDPSHFYFRLKIFDDLMDDFHSSLSLFCECDGGRQMPTSFMRPGQVCAVALNRTWHNYNYYVRGRIVKLISPNRVDVALVDEGETITTSVESIKFLHKRYVNLPVQIIPGKLAGVAPAGEEFDLSTLEEFEHYAQQLSLDAEFHDIQYDPPMFSLLLYTKDSKKSVNLILIESGSNEIRPRIPLKDLLRESVSNREPERDLMPGEELNVTIAREKSLTRDDKIQLAEYLKLEDVRKEDHWHKQERILKLEEEKWKEEIQGINDEEEKKVVSVTIRLVTDKGDPDESVPPVELELLDLNTSGDIDSEFHSGDMSTSGNEEDKWTTVQPVSSPQIGAEPATGISTTETDFQTAADNDETTTDDKVEPIPDPLVEANIDYAEYDFDIADKRKIKFTITDEDIESLERTYDEKKQAVMDKIIGRICELEMLNAFIIKYLSKFDSNGYAGWDNVQSIMDIIQLWNDSGRHAIAYPATDPRVFSPYPLISNSEYLKFIFKLKEAVERPEPDMTYKFYGYIENGVEGDSPSHQILGDKLCTEQTEKDKKKMAFMFFVYNEMITNFKEVPAKIKRMADAYNASDDEDDE